MEYRRNEIHCTAAFFSPSRSAKKEKGTDAQASAQNQPMTYLYAMTRWFVTS